MPNRKATTTSTVEWRFVSDPDGRGVRWQGPPFLPYPNEANSRVPRPFEYFEAELKRKNEELSKLGQPEVCREEFVGARLYTGPMYLKYNAVLRGLQFKDTDWGEAFEDLCLGNKYTTTLHCINSVIIKLSKLAKAAKVYRGLSGSASRGLPCGQRLWRKGRYRGRVHVYDDRREDGTFLRGGRRRQVEARQTGNPARNSDGDG